MGMFDHITFENDIPDPELRDQEWQTKSLENALLDYRVTSDGKLMLTRKEFRSREEPESFFGWRLEVVREWEEEVDHHGVIEAYTFERLEDDSSKETIYRLFFSYGKLDRLERDERAYPPVRHVPPLKDDSPRRQVTVGELELDLPESIRASLGRQEGRLHVFRFEYDGYLNAQSQGQVVVLRGVRLGQDSGPTVHSDGTLNHLEGSELEILAERHGGRSGSYLLVIAPKTYEQQAMGRVE